MQTKSCKQCNVNFETTRKDAQFCSPTCRYKYWSNQSTNLNIKFDTLEDVKSAIETTKEQFERLQRHFKKVMEYYDDFQDVVVRLDKRLEELENETTSETQQLKEENDRLKKDIKNLEETNIDLEKTLKSIKNKKINALDDLFNDDDEEFY